MDVVKRYDVDGVHFDDYFYPYPEKNFAGAEMDFPDDASWKKFGAGQRPGARRLAARKRESFSSRKLSQSIKAEKPWVKFGVSPFGIWRPQIRRASPRRWTPTANFTPTRANGCANGWCDYFAPQLYWPISAARTKFSRAAEWWRSQNVKGRHVWPGLNDAAVGGNFPPDEIARQIQASRADQPTRGEIHYHLRSAHGKSRARPPPSARNTRQPALVPASRRG